MTAVLDQFPSWPAVALWSIRGTTTQGGENITKNTAGANGKCVTNYNKIQKMMGKVRLNKCKPKMLTSIVNVKKYPGDC